MYVLIPPAGETDNYNLLWGHGRSDFAHVGYCVRGLKRGYYSLHFREIGKRRERFFVRYGNVIDLARVLKIRMLGTHARVVKTRCNGMSALYLAVFILEQVGFASVKYPY